MIYVIYVLKSKGMNEYLIVFVNSIMISIHLLYLLITLLLMLVYQEGGGGGGAQ